MAKKMAKKAIDEKAENAVAVTNTSLDAPAYIQAGSEGLQNMRREDLVLPRVQLMQALSPSVEDGSFEVGDMVNSLTGELIVPAGDVLKIIPVYHFISWIEWGDRDTNEGMKGQTTEPDHELAQACAKREMIVNGKGQEVPRVTEYHNIIAIVIPIVGQPMPILFGFAKTMHKYGKKFLGLARLRGEYPLYAGAYEVFSKSEKNRKGQPYRVIDVKNAGWASLAEFEAAKHMYEIVDESYSQNMLKWDVSPEHDAESEADIAEAAGNKEF